MTIVATIMKHIQENPGASRADLAEVLPKDTKLMTISNTLARLRRGGAIEGRGPSPKLTRWYPVGEPAKSIFLAEAEVILAQLDAMPPAARTAHLARKMQELASAPEPLF